MRSCDRLIYLGAPLIVLTAFTAWECILPGVSAKYAGWPFVLSLLVMGMPHGAVDLAVNGQLTGARSFRQQIGNFRRYLAVLVASFAAIVLVPTLALMLFVLLSAAHFGLADARDLDRLHVRSSPPLIRRLSAFARGCLLLGLPFALAPVPSLTVFADVLAVLGRPSPAVEPQIAQAVGAFAVAAGFVALSSALIARLRLGMLQAARMELLESGVLGGSFCVLEPLFAMGLYLLAWHSWRHLSVLAEHLPSASPSQNSTNRLTSLIRFHAVALPLQLPTVMVFLLVAWWRLDAWSSQGLAALAITIYAVVTPPHHLLVERFVEQTSAGCSAKRVASRGLSVAGTRSRACANIARRLLQAVREWRGGAKQQTHAQTVATASGSG